MKLKINTNLAGEKYVDGQKMTYLFENYLINY